MAIGRGHPRLTAKGPRDITPPRPRSPAPLARPTSKPMSRARTPVSRPGTNENTPGARAIRDVEIICDQALGPAWNLEWAAREGEHPREFATIAASVRSEPSLDPPGRCKKDSTQDRQSIRRARRISSRQSIFLVGEAALNVAVDRKRRLGHRHVDRNRKRAGLHWGMEPG